MLNSFILIVLSVVICEYFSFIYFCSVVQVFPAHFLKRKEKESGGSWTNLEICMKYFCVYILLWCTLHLIIIRYVNITLYCCDLILCLNMLEKL